MDFNVLEKALLEIDPTPEKEKRLVGSTEPQEKREERRERREKREEREERRERNGA